MEFILKWDRNNRDELGFRHDKDNIVFFIDDENQDSSLKIGDKIVSIDNKLMSTAKETHEALKNSKQNFEMVLKRVPYEKG